MSSEASGTTESTWLEGRVVRVLWCSPESGYAVARLETEQSVVTVVGDLLLVLGDDDPAGTFLALEGRWENHATHGRQFRVTGTLQGLPHTLHGLELYLASARIPGVGKVIASRIVEAFGVRAPRILSEEPERLAEIKGISTVRAESISTQWRQDEDGRAVAVTLRGLGLSGRIIQRILHTYGDHTAHVVATDPYRLVDDISGVGFRTADQLARTQGLPEDAPRRVEAALSHVVGSHSRDGHCYTPRHLLPEGVAALGVPTADLEGALARREAEGALVVEGDRVYVPSLFTAEVDVAWQLRDRLAHVPTQLLDAEGEVARAERYEGVTLDEGQREAVLVALRGGVSVITGGPGTGKTTLVRVLVRAARERGASWKLASPTGRAARRLEEATGQTASTIHRMLEFRPGEGGFQRGHSQPLEADGLVIDEASMIDLPLLRAVLDALPSDPSFSLVLVGDADQLPSVGPGQVLRDLVESNAVPVARLTHIHRQAAESGIVQAARALLAGTVPASGEAAPYDDLFLLARGDATLARSTLLTVVRERLPANGFDPLTDIQVLAPTRRGPLGTEALNEALQEALNPKGTPIKRGKRTFRVGDRLLCTRNNYDLEVFNGDVGRALGHTVAGLSIDFDGRVVDWPWDDLELLDLAYAMTVHKAQGSEYPAVVLALHRSHGIMLRRNLFYTALTRAKRFACVIGDPGAWTRAVSEAGGDERFTSLQQRLAEQPTLEDQMR